VFCSLSHRNRFDSGLSAGQRAAHHVGVLPIQKTDAEEEVAEAPEKTWKSAAIELEGIGPAHACAPAAQIGANEMADAIGNWPRLRAGVIPDDVAKLKSVAPPLALEHLLYQRGTIGEAGDAARARLAERGFGQQVSPGNAGQRAFLIDGLRQAYLRFRIEQHIERAIHDYSSVWETSFSTGAISGCGVSMNPGGGHTDPRSR